MIFGIILLAIVAILLVWFVAWFIPRQRQLPAVRHGKDCTPL